MIALYIALMRWIVKKTLNKIESTNDNKYYSKLKANQKKLYNKAVKISITKEPTQRYVSPLIKDGKSFVKRKVLIFTNNSCFYHNDMSHIKTIIRIDKTIFSTNKKTGEIKEILTTTFAISNLKKDAKFFYDLHLNHWKVETMHFYKDKSLYEDLHTANINPMTMTILRSFVLNILHLNKVKSIKTQLLENRWDLDTTLSLLLKIGF